MSYDLPFLCPCLSPRFCIFTTICPCYVSSIVYARLFKKKSFSIFGFLLVPFSVYGIRRYVIEELDYEEKYEVSAFKSIICNSSLTQDLHEMKLRRIGVYKYLSEPVPTEDSDIDF